LTAVWVIAKHTFRECTRRRVFLVVPVATVGFLALFALGNHFAFEATSGRVDQGFGLVDARALAGATLLGLSMFVSLFLASSLGIFLTFSAVRGDAELGVLQQLVVRPVARWGLVLGRGLGATFVCVPYVLFLYLSSVLITGMTGDWWPDPLVLPAAELGVAVIVVIALTLFGSIFLSSITNGIVMFMLYGAGLLAGLLGQLGDALSSPALSRTGVVASWVLPFEALYQSSLNSLTSGATGLTRVIVQLGPLGGAKEGGPVLTAWALFYIAAVTCGTLIAFRKRDL
jgi:Cu-processing system permease protein